MLKHEFEGWTLVAKTERIHTRSCLSVFLKGESCEYTFNYFNNNIARFLYINKHERSYRQIQVKSLREAKLITLQLIFKI